MDTIDQHIRKDEEMISDPNLSPQMRRHAKDELASLKEYQKNHPGDDHDPTALEIFCDENPDAEECRIYED